MGTLFSEVQLHDCDLVSAWLLPQLPQDKRIVIIRDNASQHSKMVKNYLVRRFEERVEWQHTPTKASWLNLIEA